MLLMSDHFSLLLHKAAIFFHVNTYKRQVTTTWLQCLASEKISSLLHIAVTFFIVTNKRQFFTAFAYGWNVFLCYLRETTFHCFCTLLRCFSPQSAGKSAKMTSIIQVKVTLDHHKSLNTHSIAKNCHILKYVICLNLLNSLHALFLNQPSFKICKIAWYCTTPICGEYLYWSIFKSLQGIERWTSHKVWGDYCISVKVHVVEMFGFFVIDRQ